MILKNKRKDTDSDDTNQDIGNLSGKKQNVGGKVKRFKVNEKDIRIVGSLISGSSNKQISTELRIPLSTIQRRTRNILQSGLLQQNFTPNYKQFGLKKGMIHVYLKDGNLKPTAEKISAMKGITSVSIHIGNSDIVGDFVYQDSEQIIDIVASIKKIEGVEKAVWSEEVYVLPVNSKNVTAPYQRLIERGFS